MHIDDFNSQQPNLNAYDMIIFGFADALEEKIFRYDGTKLKPLFKVVEEYYSATIQSMKIRRISQNIC